MRLLRSDLWAFHSRSLRTVSRSDSSGLRPYTSCPTRLGGALLPHRRQSFVRLWRDNFFWTGPTTSSAAPWRDCSIFGTSTSAGRARCWSSPPSTCVYRSYRLYLSRLDEEKRHVGEMADLHLRTIQALALAIDARDGTTHAHLRRVQLFTRELARELGLQKRIAAPWTPPPCLHDIGKLAVPEYIISKPGKLTPEEFEKMKIHPIVGARRSWRASSFPIRWRPLCVPITRNGTARDTRYGLAARRSPRRAHPFGGRLPGRAGVRPPVPPRAALDEAMAKIVRKAVSASTRGW